MAKPNPFQRTTQPATPVQAQPINAKVSKVLAPDHMKTTHNPANRLPANTRHKLGARGKM